MKEFIDNIRNQVKLCCVHFLCGNLAAFSICWYTSELQTLILSGTILGIIIEGFWYEMDENSKNKTALIEFRKIIEYTAGSAYFCLVRFYLGGC